MNTLTTIPPVHVLGRPSAPPSFGAAGAVTATFRPRFTLDGDERLEAHLGGTCDRIAAALRGLLPTSRLQAVLLGGGYGRGEGGVWHTPAGDRAYNDLEFYVFLRGNRHLNECRYGRALHVLGEILTPQAGIDVEFRIASLPELIRGDVSMFSYDLVSGHHSVVGQEALLIDCDHHREAADIPPAEATRLLMNRCSGLLFARERLSRRHFTAADADFVARNIAKAQLGAGDAVLTIYGQYHWSVRERRRRLERLIRAKPERWLAEVCCHHEAGVSFKLHPTRSDTSHQELLALHARVTEMCREVWHWVESPRLGRSFRTAREYADRNVTKCPESVRARNALANVRLFGVRGIAGLLRHPRERVLNALPLLLWQPDALASPVLRQRLQTELRTRAADFSGMVDAYRSIWSRVN